MEPKPKMTILVVDDSKTMHKMYGVMLREYPLYFAQKRQETLELLREHQQIELVLFDTGNPNMEATELFAELRDQPRPPAVVAIFTEGNEERADRAVNAGAVAAIRKPFQSEEINTLVARLEASLRSG